VLTAAAKDEQDSEENIAADGRKAEDPEPRAESRAEPRDGPVKEVKLSYCGCNLSWLDGGRTAVSWAASGMDCSFSTSSVARMNAKPVAGVFETDQVLSVQRRHQTSDVVSM